MLSGRCNRPIQGKCLMSATEAAAAKEDAFFFATLAEADPEIADVVAKELGRQRDEIELIASENIVSRAVLEAQGSVLTNKYAEGYPGRRYYGGCQFVDIAENIAIERAKKLFGCSFANVQPNSGSQMNQAVFLALMEPGDTFMGLDLAAGGPLTHGSPVNLSGKWFKAVHYGVRRDDHLIDMGEVARIAREAKPKIIIAGGSAYSRFWDFKRFREIADEVGAYLMVDMAHFAGLVAGGGPPVPGARAPRGGTDNHLMLVDLRPKTLTGKVAEMALGRAHITCNKNGIPFDPEKPMVTSGVRLGTPAGTTRGFGVAEFHQIGDMIVEVLDVLSQKHVEQDSLAEAAVRDKVKALVERFPIYQ